MSPGYAGERKGVGGAVNVGNPEKGGSESITDSK